MHSSKESERKRSIPQHFLLIGNPPLRFPIKGQLYKALNYHLTTQKVVKSSQRNTVSLLMEDKAQIS